MTWHETEHAKGGKLRHPIAAQAWKDFDSMHTHFASNPWNVRLGLTMVLTHLEP